MNVKKMFAFMLLFFGIVSLVVGVGQINKGVTPNTCVVSFAKSLGGKASFELDQSTQKAKSRGIVGVSVGVIFSLAGGVLLLKSRK